LHTENWKILLKNSSVNLDRNHYIWLFHGSKV
jgi:hypothetical protein